jgi:hypothetical protein
LGKMIPAYSGQSLGVQAICRLAQLQPGMLAQPTLIAAAVLSVLLSVLLAAAHTGPDSSGPLPVGSATI